jgi:hypothetical protein
LKPISRDGSQHRQAVDGYLKLGQAGDGLGISNLTLCHTDE